MSILRNKLVLGALVGALTLGFGVQEASAKKLGGNKAMGKQSSSVTQRQQSAPQQGPTAAKPAAPAATPAPAAPAPQPQKSGIGGMLGGLAAGVGLGMLASHLFSGSGGGLGGGGFFSTLLMLVAAFFIGKWLLGKFRASQQNRTPSLAGAGDAPAPMARSQWDAQAPVSTPSFGGAAPTINHAAPTQQAPWGVPEGFDTDSFLRAAKVYYVRLQAAWDVADLNDIREFTTPEMFAEIKMDLADRGTAQSKTEVGTLNAELLGIEHGANDYLASVQFTGTVSEDGAPQAPFSEVWNLSKPLQGAGGWVLAGIQQG